MDEEAFIPESVPLAQPRPLTSHERALVDWFVDGPVNSPEMRAQADAASVVATCSCGCPSVDLEVPPGVPAAPLNSDDPDVRNSEDASFIARATSPDGREVNVILHVIAGRLVELEIWAGMYGGDRRTELPDVSTLSR
jgi:hypothetical protein